MSSFTYDQLLEAMRQGATITAARTYLAGTDREVTRTYKGQVSFINYTQYLAGQSKDLMIHLEFAIEGHPGMISGITVGLSEVTSLGLKETYAVKVTFEEDDVNGDEPMITFLEVQAIDWADATVQASEALRVWMITYDKCRLISFAVEKA